VFGCQKTASWVKTYFFEEALLDKLLQVFFEGLEMDGLVSFAVVVRVVLL